MLRTDLTNDAIRFLKKRDAKQFIQIFTAISQLCGDQRPADSIAMRNGKHFRKDVGEFRIIYSFDKEILYVAVIGNRNDGAAYQEFDRKR
jgi:mRNA interferase RelE/StbE